MTAKEDAKPQSFFKKHDRTLTFVGAIIVFCTFIVKENLREDWKGTAETIESAQSAYALRQDIYKTVEAQNKTISLLTEPRVEMDNSQLAELRNLDQPFINKDEIQDALDRTEPGLALITSLIEKMPENSTFLSRSEALKEKYKILKSEYFDALQYQPIEFRKQQDKLPRYILLVTQKKLTTINEVGSKLNEGTYKLYDEVIAQAELLRTNNKTKAQFAAWVTNMFFIFGWGLGLAGKLAGLGETSIE